MPFVEPDADEEDEVYNGGSELGQKVVRPLWQELQADVMQRLDAITLEDLCGRARTIGIGPESGTTSDFEI